MILENEKLYLREIEKSDYTYFVIIKDSYEMIGQSELIDVELY